MRRSAASHATTWPMPSGSTLRCHCSSSPCLRARWHTCTGQDTLVHAGHGREQTADLLARQSRLRQAVKRVRPRQSHMKQASQQAGRSYMTDKPALASAQQAHQPGAGGREEALSRVC